MDVRVEIKLNDGVPSAGRDNILEALRHELHEADPSATLTVAPARLGGFAAPDLHLLQLLLHSAQNFDSGSLAAGTGAGLGIGAGAKTIGRMLKRLGAFARQLAGPITLKMGSTSVQLPADATPKDVERLVRRLGMKPPAKKPPKSRRPKTKRSTRPRTKRSTKQTASGRARPPGDDNGSI
jgi:hypothetical protein